jgi:hypothetical protein
MTGWDTILRQERLDKTRKASTSGYKSKKRSEKSRFTEIDIADFKGHPLWNILVDTARSNPLYTGRLSYTRTRILADCPDIDPRGLASKLSIPVGEAIVILEDARTAV